MRDGDGHELYALFGRHRGPGTRAPAQVLARGESEPVDLALVRARADRCPAVRLGPPPALGDRTWIVGFPWGRQIRLISGIVSQVALDEPGAPRPVRP